MSRFRSGATVAAPAEAPAEPPAGLGTLPPPPPDVQANPGAAEDDTLATPPAPVDPAFQAPPLPPTTVFYRVFTPNRDFAGTRFGIEFLHGEAVIPETHRTLMQGKDRVTPVEYRTLDLLEVEMGYRIERIPDGVPPYPTWMSQQGTW